MDHLHLSTPDELDKDFVEGLAETITDGNFSHVLESADGEPLAIILSGGDTDAHEVLTGILADAGFTAGDGETYDR